MDGNGDDDLSDEIDDDYAVGSSGVGYDDGGGNGGGDLPWKSCFSTADKSKFNVYVFATLRKCLPCLNGLTAQSSL